MSNVAEVAGRVSAGEGAPVRGWLAVVVVATGTFTVVTSEMMPVGLLTPMGRALNVTEGTIGLTLTITGVVATVSAPLSTLVVGRWDRRTVLVALMTLLAGANLLSAWSPNFVGMVVARILIGVGMGGVWSFAAGLAPRLVPRKSVGSATSLIFSGIAVASVLGVPAGAWVGGLIGWRAAFVVIGALALLVAVAMLVLLPRLPAEQAVLLGGVLRLFRHPRVITGLVLVILLVTGHFAAYTYVRPVMEDVAGVGAGQIGTLLLVYGIAGVLGNFASGTGAVRAPRGTLVVLSAVLTATVLLVPVLGSSVLGAGVLMAVWGMAYGGVSVSTQTWLMMSAPEAREAVSSLFVGVFSGAIALGALAGGLTVDGLGVTAVMWLAGALALGALVTAVVGRSPVARS